ncbi:MAG: glycosyl transferase, partial [Clostridia bacterium]|nr:glycosyl transferase [Clostridia bacterium]
MFSIKTESKAVRVVVIILMAAMLSGCIFASIYYNDKLLLGSFEKYDDDDVKYLRSAETFIKTGQLTYRYPDKPTVFIMPGITLFL